MPSHHTTIQVFDFLILTTTPARAFPNFNFRAMSTENEDRLTQSANDENQSQGQNVNREGGYRPRTNGYNPNYNRDSRQRPYRPYNQSGQQGGYNRYNNDRPRRPRFTPNNGDNEDDGQQRSYRRVNSYNPNFSNGGDGQQRSYRPRTNSYNRQGNYNSGQPGGYSPRYNNGSDDQQGTRPHRQRINDGYSQGYRQGRPNNRYQQGGGRSFRPRTADYNPNAKYSMKKRIEYKEILADPNEPIRLNKYLANAGICSRREADEYITQGAVSVNGVVVTELGTKVLRSDEVKFHDQRVRIEHKVYILLNKPKDTVTTSEDPQERKTVMDLVRNACPERIYPVGRLDRNTTGVLLLTNDGDLASKLTHPKFQKKKIYQVTLDKPLNEEDLEKIKTGIELEDGEIHADDINYPKLEDKKIVGIEIHSGRNRIVRRIFEAVGYKVYKLDRVYFAGLTKKGLRRGDWRFLTEQEVSILHMGSFE